MKFYVEVVEYSDPEKIVKRMGVMSESKAEKIDAGITVNLNHEKYFTRVVNGRKS